MHPKWRCARGPWSCARPPSKMGKSMRRSVHHPRRGFDRDLAFARNERWIREQMRQGRRVIDIGPDFQRREATGKRSDFYEMERRAIEDYENYTKVFERSGAHGGVPDLDF